MKQLVFYKDGDTYTFKLIDNDSLCDYSNILHIWKVFQNNIIECLKNVHNSLFIHVLMLHGTVIFILRKFNIVL